MTNEQKRAIERLQQTLPVRTHYGVTPLNAVGAPKDLMQTRGLPESQIERMRQLENMGYKRNEIAIEMKISPASVTKYLGVIRVQSSGANRRR